MLYRVFNNQTELDEANVRWIAARDANDTHDICNGVIVNPCVTIKWDDGRLLNDGRIACQIPTTWVAEFGGLELELSEDVFIQNDGIM